MRVKILKNYTHKTSIFKKDTEVDVDNQTGKMLIKKKVARKFGENFLDKIVIKHREYKRKTNKK